MKIKKHAKSKTQWFNVAMMTMGIISIVEQNAHFLRENFGDTGYGVFLMILGVIGFILRTYTTEPIDDK